MKRRTTRSVWTKRSVRRDVTRFAGWDRMIELAKTLRQDLKYQALYATCFLTGGRISEVLSLTPENFVMGNEFVSVTGMPLLKRYRKVGTFIEEKDLRPSTNIGRLYQQNPETGKWWRKRYETEPITETRSDFDIRRDEPLCSIMVDWLGKAESELLFPDITRWKAWKTFSELGIYPHWLRAQRASCLISFWGFTMDQMMEWMGWEEITTARRYAKMGPKLRDLLAKVEIPVLVKDAENRLRAGVNAQESGSIP